MTLKKYLKLRKQNDTVKLITILFIVLSFFIISGIVDIVNYYKSINTKIEYQLTCTESIEKVKSKLTELRKLDNCIDADIIKEYYIAFKQDGTQILVKEAKKDYMLKCYNINDNQYHMNNSAFLQGDNDKSNILMTFLKDEKQQKGYFVLDKSIDDSTPIILKANNNISVSKDEPINVSAVFSKVDISGETSKTLESSGFTINNKTDIEIQKFNNELFFVKLKYNVIILFILIVFILVTIKIYKKSS